MKSQAFAFLGIRIFLEFGNQHYSSFIFHHDHFLVNHLLKSHLFYQLIQTILVHWNMFDVFFISQNKALKHCQSMHQLFELAKHGECGNKNANYQ